MQDVLNDHVFDLMVQITITQKLLCVERHKSDNILSFLNKSCPSISIKEVESISQIFMKKFTRTELIEQLDYTLPRVVGTLARLYELCCLIKV